MTRVLRVLAAAVATAALAVSGEVSAQSLPEQDFGEPWNSVGVGVRAIGMGGAFTALSDDLSGAYWNPAGLIRMKDTQLGIMFGDPFSRRNPTRQKDKGQPEDVSKWLGRFQFEDVWQNVGSMAFVTTGFKPWVAGLTYMRSFHPESLIPWQEDWMFGTFVIPFNNSRTGGLGVNIKYLRSDRWYQNFLAEPTQPGNKDVVVYPDDTAFTFQEVGGWGLDVGGFYAIPMLMRDRYRQLNFGFMARNLVGRRTVGRTETEMARQATGGIALIFDDLVPRQRTIISTDYSSALLSKGEFSSSQLKVGFEQRAPFLNGYLAGRFGYATPMPVYDRVKIAEKYMFQGRPSWSGGISYLGQSLSLDFAVTFPPQAQELETRSTGDLNNSLTETPFRYIPPTSDLMPVEKVRWYAQVTWHWRGPTPPPFARVSVEPVVFSPKKGESAVFTMDYRDEGGLESWVLEIRNSARMPVRVFSGKGSPPPRLVWDGLDDRFNLAQDDDHTYTLKVRNQAGLETVTPAQAFRIFTPDSQTKGDPTLIYRLNEQQLKKEKGMNERMDPELKDRLDLGGTPTGDVPVPAPAPVEPAAPSSTPASL